jgi:hypothetical protein
MSHSTGEPAISPRGEFTRAGCPVNCYELTIARSTVWFDWRLLLLVVVALVLLVRYRVDPVYVVVGSA